METPSIETYNSLGIEVCFRYKTKEEAIASHMKAERFKDRNNLTCDHLTIGEVNETSDFYYYSAIVHTNSIAIMLMSCVSL